MKKILLPIIVAFALTACGPAEPSNRTAKGNPNASVVVTEYFDLQCPACKSVHENLVGAMLEQFGDRIRYEAMHFPLRSIHRHALDTGMAAECAADQGKFWEYVDIAFANQSSMNEDSIRAWGSEIGLNDVAAFEQCLSSERKKGTVLADYKQGTELGVRGTPTFFVNGEQVATNEILEVLEEKTGGNMPL